MVKSKIKIYWEEVKGRDGVIDPVNKAYEEGYAKGAQEGWTKHKAATENKAPNHKSKKSGRPDPGIVINIDETKKVTDKAIMFVIGGEVCWLPKSQLWAINLDDDGQIESVHIPTWLAESNGLGEDSREPDDLENMYEDDIPF